MSVVNKSILKSAIIIYVFLSCEIVLNKSLLCMLKFTVLVPGGLKIVQTIIACSVFKFEFYK